MVVWQGITEGGTAVPVQITEEGKVVAIGEKGQKGDTGEEGPPGPEGPPGEAEWPPNPIEGAFLVWLNGQPAWYAESPIPTPPGVAGPVIEVSDNSLLTFGNDLDQNVFFQNVNVYAAKADGSSWDGDGQYNTNQVWSNDFVINSSSGGAIKNVEAMFDGILNTEPNAFNFYGLDSTFNPGIPVTNSIRFWCRSGGSVSAKFQTAGVVAIPAGGSMNWVDLSVTNDVLIGIIGNSSGGANIAIGAIEVDGKILLDPKVGPYPRGQISVVANNSVVLTRVAGTWAVGDYMKADESTQAAWLFQKNRNALKG